MKVYIGMYIVKPDNQETITQVNKTIEQLFATNGSKMLEFEEQGVRGLAYEIQNFTQGYYVKFVVEATLEAVKEYNRICNINENIIRHILVLKDE